MSDHAPSHDAFRDMLASVAAGTASGNEARETRAHAERCADCRADLASLEAAGALVGLAAPTGPVRDLGAVRGRLLARIAAEKSGPAEPRSAERARGSGARPWVAAAAAALLVIVPFAALMLSARGSARSAEAELARARAEAAAAVAQLRDSLAARDAMLAALTGPEVQVVDLASTARAEPRGRMFWDRRVGRWTLVAHDLPALPPGRTYQLWVITRAGTRISAGTFAPVAGGAVVQATYDLPRDQLGAIAVTEEPEGGVPQPTGDIVLVGTPS